MSKQRKIKGRKLWVRSPIEQVQSNKKRVNTTDKSRQLRQSFDEALNELDEPDDF